MRNALHVVLILAAALAFSAGSYGCREKSEGDKQLEQAASQGETAQPAQPGQPAQGGTADEGSDDDSGDGGEGETSGGGGQ